MLRYQKRGACSSKYQKCICRLLCACFWFKYMVSLPVYREVVAIFFQGGIRYVLCEIDIHVHIVHPFPLIVNTVANRKWIKWNQSRIQWIHPYMFVYLDAFHVHVHDYPWFECLKLFILLVLIIHYWQNAKCTVSIFPWNVALNSYLCVFINFSSVNYWQPWDPIQVWHISGSGGGRGGMSLPPDPVKISKKRSGWPRHRETGNLVLTFSRQGKHREFCSDTGKNLLT